MSSPSAAYRDRADAGRVLASQLAGLDGKSCIVLALPRGGVPVGFEVARTLGADLDVLVVRKVGVPDDPELAAGAIAPGGVRIWNAQIVRQLDRRALAQLEAEARVELARRERAYRGDRQPPVLAGRTVIVVDDGVATGATMRAAIAAARGEGAARVIVAAPVVAGDVIEQLRAEADQVVCPATPELLHAVGQWYERFEQLDDDAVREILARAWAVGATARDADEVIPAGSVSLAGALAVPAGATGLVLVVDTGGNGRRTTRRRVLGEALREVGLATLLLDLLTENEERHDAAGTLRYDMALLSGRLLSAVQWVTARPEIATMRVAVLGTESGAAAALAAAAAWPEAIAAVVSCAGRLDLVATELAAVRAPALLLVGARDSDGLARNRLGAARLRGPKALQVIPDAGPMFDEPGALEAAARRAAAWLAVELSPAATE